MKERTNAGRRVTAVIRSRSGGNARERDPLNSVECSSAHFALAFYIRELVWFASPSLSLHSLCSSPFLLLYIPSIYFNLDGMSGFARVCCLPQLLHTDVSSIKTEELSKIAHGFRVEDPKPWWSHFYPWEFEFKIIFLTDSFGDQRIEIGGHHNFFSRPLQQHIRVRHWPMPPWSNLRMFCH